MNVRLKQGTNILRFFLVLASAALSACSWFGDEDPERDPKKISDTYYQLGVRYMDLNKLEIAKEKLLVAIDEDSKNAQAYNALAFLNEKLKRYDDAEDYYETAFDLKPEDFGILNNYGRFWCERGKTDKGMAMLTKAGNNPLNDRPWLALTNAGRCQLAIGRSQEAEAFFRKALAANSAYAPALAAMQKISYQKHDYWPAKAFLARYLSVAAHTPETLYLAFQTERALGNQVQADEYRKQLLEKFPNSNEVKLLPAIK